MPRRNLGIGLIVAGGVVLAAALGADALGIGTYNGAGPVQALGALAGVIIAGVGAWYWPGVPQAPRTEKAATRKQPAPAKGKRPAKSAGRAASARKTKKRHG